jgi:hypothetical protein
MTEILSKFEPGELIGLVAVAGGIVLMLICGVASIISDGLYKVRQLALKQEMLERGMSAEEIESVIEAGWKKPKTCLSARAAVKPEASHS